MRITSAFLIPIVMITTFGILAFICATCRPARGQAEAARAHERKLTELLDTRVKLLETPLTEVVAQLERAHDINIRIDDRALSDAGLSEDEPITFWAPKGISLRSALLVNLRNAGLVCVTEQGGLLISTPEATRNSEGILPGLTMPKPPSKPGIGSPGQAVMLALKNPSGVGFIDRPPLTTVTASLQDKHDVAIFIDFKALKDAKIDPRVPVTTRVDGVSLHSVLLLVLGQLGLTCARQDEFLMVTTPKGAPFWGGALQPLPISSGTGPSIAHQKIRVALSSRTDADFQKAPLCDVLEYVEFRHQIPIFIDRRALKREKIPLDVPVTIEPREERLDSVLRRILGDLNLVHTFQHEVLLITSMQPVFTFSTGGRHHFEGHGEWLVTLTDTDALLVEHWVRDKKERYGPHMLSEIDRRNLEALIERAKASGLKSSTRAAVPDSVKWTISFKPGDGSETHQIWSQDAEKNDELLQLAAQLGKFVEVHTKKKPVGFPAR